MLKRLVQRVDRAIWGSAAVRCEECGRSLTPHAAVWHGAHPYCSAVHESYDADGLVLSH